MQRIMVDLPEPDGPQMTMRSPRMTFRLMSLSTLKSPYHFDMPTISIATSVSEMCIFLTSTLISSALTAFSVIISVTPCLSFVAGVEPAFHVERIPRHTEAEEPEYDGCENEAG